MVPVKEATIDILAENLHIDAARFDKLDGWVF